MFIEIEGFVVCKGCIVILVVDIGCLFGGLLCFVCEVV